MLKQDKTGFTFPRETWFFPVANFLIEFIEKQFPRPEPAHPCRIISIPAILSGYRQLVRR